MQAQDPAGVLADPMLRAPDAAGSSDATRPGEPVRGSGWDRARDSGVREARRSALAMQGDGLTLWPAGPPRAVAARTGAPVVTLIPSVGGGPGAGDLLALFDRNVEALAAALDEARPTR